jgi:hypothetical protein
MNILEIKIKLQAVKKRERRSIIEMGCNEEENEEILKLLFKTYLKGVMLTPIFVNLFFRYSYQ